ncbi:hypothetical protein QTL97_14815 [Sporosarcina thermotolerans]|uniref:DUF4340 domain-containing protein n=1 Tax=Sporosarcina thermotolerans TaxID=633404 RepID=A0AAW9A9Y8_9BACL|nr:hypothetical protein [Sporosarcina thermotolerans]MDW0118202.1 hypothetical protein [Sporosarcina thermotolerans]WHT47683.1 hypothetical protein QNH10_16360 [Sporosarcina thermotolerans]
MKKIIIILVFIVSVVGIYLLNVASKDDMVEIRKVVVSLEKPELRVAHIELLEKNSAVAFYEWGRGEESSFGSVLLKKGLLGWEIINGGSLYLLEESKVNWGHLDLRDNLSNYTDLLRGKITDPKIERVNVITKNGIKYQATVRKYNNDDDSFWFLISNGEELLGATIMAISFEGDVIEEIQTSN